MDDEERVKIASQVTRLKILRMLPNYTSDMAKKLDIDRKSAAWHLKKLQDAGLVESKYMLEEESKRPETLDRAPIAVRNFKLTGKGKQILERIDKKK